MIICYSSNSKLIHQPLNIKAGTSKEKWPAYNLSEKRCIYLLLTACFLLVSFFQNPPRQKRACQELLKNVWQKQQFCIPPPIFFKTLYKVLGGVPVTRLAANSEQPVPSGPNALGLLTCPHRQGQRREQQGYAWAWSPCRHALQSPIVGVKQLHYQSPLLAPSLN